MRAPPGLPTAGAGGWLRNGERGGAARRVSCVLWTLETLARSWPGQTAPMARAVGAGTRLPRRETGARGGASGAGWCGERGPAWGAAGCGEARSLRLSGARNACAQRGRGRTAPMARAVGAKRKKRGPCRRGAGPFLHAGGRKKFFLSKKSFLSMKRNFFGGAGRTKKARLPGGGGGRRLSNNPFGEVWRTRRSSKVNSYRPALPGGRGVCAPGRKHFLSFWRKRPPQADFFDKLSPPSRWGRRAMGSGGNQNERRSPI